MPSPFPGMDPYLEHPGWWPDFHARFIPICSEALNEVLPDEYDARIETSARLAEIDDEELRLVAPDVYVASRRRSSARKRKPRAGCGTATLDQVTLRTRPFKKSGIIGFGCCTARPRRSSLSSRSFRRPIKRVAVTRNIS